MPLHWQKGELSFQEDSVLVGSLVIMDFIESSASLSLAFWDEFDSTNGRRGAWENKLREKIKRVNDSLHVLPFEKWKIAPAKQSLV